MGTRNGPDEVEARVSTDSLFSTVVVGPDAVRRATGLLAPGIEEIAARVAASADPHLFMVGGGASLSALMAADYLLDRFTTVPCDVYTSAEFVARSPRAVNEGSVVIGASYSGQTPEAREAFRVAAARGALKVAVTASRETPLAREADVVLDSPSKAVYTAPLAMVYLLCAHIMTARRENPDVGDAIRAELLALPGKLERITRDTRPVARELARRFADSRGFYVLGAGPLYGLAYKLALSVVIENLWLHGCPVNSGDFYHGPIEIVPHAPGSGNDADIMHLIGTDASRAASEKALAFCRSRGTRSLVFDARDYPDVGELFSPFALFVPTEWFIMYMAACRNHDVDERRYMGKVSASWGEY